MVLTRQAFLLGGWSLSVLWLGACEGSVSAPLVAADAAQDTAGAVAATGEPGLRDTDISSEQRPAEAGRAGASESTYTGDDAAAENGAGVAAGQPGSQSTQSAGSGGQQSSATSGIASAAGSSGTLEPTQPTPTMPSTPTQMSPQADNPVNTCSLALPPEAIAIEISQSAVTIGTGTPSSCTFEALEAAVKQGGTITFDCGNAPTVIAFARTIEVPTDRDTVIDGAGLVTFDGRDRVRLLRWDSPDWRRNTHTLTLQHLTLVHGRAVGTMSIPSRPAPCSQGFTDGQGGAVYMRDGGFRAVDVMFDSNAAAELGPDTAGGAVFVMGSLPGAYFSSCSITGNRASNGGGVGALFVSQFIYNSVLEYNSAVGSGANNVDPNQCAVPNEAGVFQVGSGGNGGAVYNDGVGVDVTICGSRISDNRAGTFGAGVFFTSNDASHKGTLVIQDSVMYQNEPQNAVWEWVFGVSTNANTPEPVNSDIRR